MIEKTVLERLSAELGDAEREELHQKLKRMVVATESESPEVERKEPPEEVKKSRIRQEMAQESFIEKIINWILAKVTARTAEEVFVSRKLKVIRRDINRKTPGITGFETRNLTPVLAKEVYSLYKATTMVKRYFEYLWLKDGKYEDTVTFLISQRITGEKRKLVDFLPMEDMVKLFGKDGQKEALKKELLSRLMKYTDGIPPNIIAGAEVALEPFYYLKDIVLFPFTGFFQLFGYNPAALAGNDQPYFQNASAMLVLKFLESLYIAGELDGFIPEPIDLDPFLVRYLDKKIEESERVEFEGAVAWEEETPEFILEERLKNTQNDIQELHRKIQKFHRQVPVLELLRYFHKDPFYMVVRKIPGLHFRDFYFMILRESLLKELDQEFPGVRRRYIQSEIDALFRTKTYYTLQNYRQYSSIDYDKLGLPFFRHTQSINLLYNYVRNFYRTYFYDLFQILIRNVLVNNRLFRERLEKGSSSLEELEQRIREFDYSLSPDSEDGKLFQRLRFSLASDPSHQKMFRGLVLQKDRQVKSILDRGDEELAGLMKILDEIQASPSQPLKVQLGTHYLFQGRSTMLSELMTSRKEHLSKFRNIFLQIYKLENN